MEYGCEPVRKFKVEDQDYLFRHIQKELRLNSHKSKDTTEKEKSDKFLPLNSAVQKLIHRILNKPNVKHVPPAILQELYPLPQDHPSLWDTIPKVDPAVVTGNSNSCISSMEDPVPKNPIDRKAETAIKRAFKLAASQPRVSLNFAYASRALLTWLERGQRKGRKTLTSSSSKWKTYAV